MVAAIILLVLGTISSAIFIASKVINYSKKTIIFKTVASLFFVALGAVCVGVAPAGHTAFKVLALLGLIFGMLGDVFLGFKYITEGRAKKLWILAGMFAFAAGHIFYIVSLFVEYYEAGHWLFIILPIVTAGILSTIYMIIAPKFGIRFGKLLPFGIFYLLCLSFMLSTAFYMALLHEFSIVTGVMFFIGAFSFACSDTMLTGSYFKEGKRPGWYNATYSVFYYVAQFLIAFSLFFLV